MRTTLTIDDDVAYRLKKLQESEPSKPFKEIVNEILRRGLTGETSKTRRPFKIHARNLGLREGLSFDDNEQLLDIAEGADRR